MSSILRSLIFSIFYYYANLVLQVLLTSLYFLFSILSSWVVTVLSRLVFHLKDSLSLLFDYRINQHKSNWAVKSNSRFWLLNCAGKSTSLIFINLTTRECVPATMNLSRVDQRYYLFHKVSYNIPIRLVSEQAPRI